MNYLKNILILLTFCFANAQSKVSFEIKDCRNKDYNSVSVDTIKLFRNNEVYKTFLYSSGVFLDNLNAGNYYFEYSSLYGNLQTEPFTLPKDLISIESCVDSLDIKNSKNPVLFFDRLKNNEKIVLNMSFTSCDSRGKDSIQIIKKNNKIYLVYGHRKIKIEKENLMSLRKFELELRNLKPSNSICTTVILNEIQFNKESISYTENCEGWNGFHYLLTELKLK